MQADLFAARSRGHALAGLAADRAESVAPGWVDMAVERLGRWARAQRQPFTIEAARTAIAADLPEPTDGRAWGQVALVAKRRGVIVQVPRLYLPAASSHGSPKPAYVGA